MPMRLEAGDDSFEMTVLGYQYPDDWSGDWYNSNWLAIEGNVTLGDRRWSFSDPSLTTFEALMLADWLDDVCRGTERHTDSHFIEPNLQFEKVSDSTIRVAFAWECEPPWAERGDSLTKHGFDVPIGLSLQKAAAQLRVMLKNFPVRGKPPA